jgi:hypothetical protein
MCVALMDDPTRGVLGSQPPEEPQNPAQSSAGPAESGAVSVSSPSATASGTARPGPDPKFIGDAMRSLYRSSATSIERGDATRVIGRAEAGSIRPAPSSTPAPRQSPSSVPSGPRVDVTLWLVLALGLFAIAGVMLSGAL